MLRDHEPIVLEEFNGLWARGDADSVPEDHFSDCENVQYIQSGFKTRDGLDTFRHVGLGNILRIYNYTMQEGQSLLFLVEGGDIYHSLDETTTYGPILSISGMDDFNMFAYAGRAYITPISRSITILGQTREVGMQDEFLYVYKGDGTNARKAAGDPPTQDTSNPHLLAYNSSLIGTITEGIHVVGVTFSDGADDSTAIGTTIKPVIYATGENKLTVANIPIGGVGITERRIWLTKTIAAEDWNPDTTTYTYYLAYTVPDNTTISVTIDIADAALVTAFAAGTLPNPTSGGITAENTDTEGYCDIGLHVIGVVFETDTGYYTSPGPENLAVQSFVNNNRSILVSNIPISADSFVVARHLVASKAIIGYNGDDLGYQLFFIPEATLNDNVTTTLEVNFYDLDLLDDASHLIENFAEIPAGVALTTFNGRLVLSTMYTDISLVRVSFPGEPEAFDQVDGLIIIPLDGNPVTNAQEFRDVLYITKQIRTFAVNDNGDVPSSWEPIVIDQGIGAPIHGISTVLDSGGVNIDYILICDYSGVMIFNGAYQRPELTFKVADYWLSLDRSFFGYIQIMNDSLNQRLYITLPNKKILYGDYANGLNPKDIRWAKWRFPIETTTIALMETDTLVIGAQTELS